MKLKRKPNGEKHNQKDRESVKKATRMYMSKVRITEVGAEGWKKQKQLVGEVKYHTGPKLAMEVFEQTRIVPYRTRNSFHFEDRTIDYLEFDFPMPSPYFHFLWNLKANRWKKCYSVVEH